LTFGDLTCYRSDTSTQQLWLKEASKAVKCRRPVTDPGHDSAVFRPALGRTRLGHRVRSSNTPHIRAIFCRTRSCAGYSPSVEERSIVMSVSLCVCLPASISPEPHVQYSPNFVSVLLIAVARSSCGRTAMHLCISSFTDDVTFAHELNGQRYRRRKNA